MGSVGTKRRKKKKKKVEGIKEEEKKKENKEGKTRGKEKMEGEKKEATSKVFYIVANKPNEMAQAYDCDLIIVVLIII